MWGSCKRSKQSQILTQSVWRRTSKSHFYTGLKLVPLVGFLVLTLALITLFRSAFKWKITNQTCYWKNKLKIVHNSQYFSSRKGLTMVTIMPYLQMTMHFDFNIMLVAFTFTGILYVKAAAWFKRQNSSLRLGSFPEGHPVNGKMLCTSRSTFCLK